MSSTVHYLRQSMSFEYDRKSLTSMRSHSKVPSLTFPLSPPDKSPGSQTVMQIKHADVAATIPRFHHLLRQSKALVTAYGPYTTYAGTTVFSRASTASTITKALSAKGFALSLATARGCINSAQAEGPAKEDLVLFKELWDATLFALDVILETGNLGHETFGWGMFGLCAGYINQGSWRDDSQYLSLKTRLHNALLKMPNMDTPKRRITLGAVGKIEILAKANREIHVCANLILQQFRQEEWKRIQWFHGVAVVERWIGHLGLGMGME